MSTKLTPGVYTREVDEYDPDRVWLSIHFEFTEHSDYVLSALSIVKLSAQNNYYEHHLTLRWGLFETQQFWMAERISHIRQIEDSYE